MTAPKKWCKDCLALGITSYRLADKPGPRCATHWFAEEKRRKAAAHGSRTEKTYGISIEEYWQIFEAQGRCCAICRRAKGISKRLAVDHDHDLARLHGHDPKVGCRECTRGLLCTTCNRTVVGQYDAVALQRAIDYLAHPPARAVLEP